MGGLFFVGYASSDFAEGSGTTSLSGLVSQIPRVKSGISCGIPPSAIERSEKLMQETVKGFPEYLKTAQEIFPNLKFENVEE